MRSTTEVANRKTAGTLRAEKRGNRAGLAARKGRNPSTAARLTLLLRLSSASLCLQRPKNGGHWVDKVIRREPALGRPPLTDLLFEVFFFQHVYRGGGRTRRITC